MHLGGTQDKFLPGIKHNRVTAAEKGRNNLTGPLLLAYARRVRVQPEEMLEYFSGVRSLEQLLAAAAQPSGIAKVDLEPKAPPRVLVSLRAEQPAGKGKLDRVRQKLYERYPEEKTGIALLIDASELIGAEGAEEVEVYAMLDDLVRMIKAAARGRPQHAPAFEHTSAPPASQAVIDDHGEKASNKIGKKLPKNLPHEPGRRSRKGH